MRSHTMLGYRDWEPKRYTAILYSARQALKLSLILNLRLSWLLLMLVSCTASATDPFGVFDRTLTSPLAELRPGEVCDTAGLSGTVTLARAVERALCANPATRSAWLAARLRAAEMGVAYSLPA